MTRSLLKSIPAIIFSILPLLLVIILLHPTYSVFSQNNSDTMEEEYDDTEEEDLQETTTQSTKLKNKIYNKGKVLYATSKTKFKFNSVTKPAMLDYIEYKVDQGNFKKSQQDGFSITKEGYHVVLYRGVDKAGNKESLQVFLVVIDNTPPSVQISKNVLYFEKNGTKYISAKTKISIQASDKNSGIKNIFYSVNGINKKYIAPFVVNSSGSTSIKFYAEDNLENKSTVQTFKITVDKKGPELEIIPSIALVNNAGKKYTVLDNTYSIKATDTNSGVSRILYKITGENEYHEYLGSIAFSSPGEKIIFAKAIDKVGNSSAVYKLSGIIVIDSIPQTSLTPDTK